MKEKTKKFIKDNWKVIVWGSIYVGACVGGVLIGRKIGANLRNNSNNLGKTTNDIIPYDSTIYKVLVDARKEYPGIHLTYGGAFNDSYTADQLGALGENMKTLSNYDPSDSYTHFIVIGEKKK